MMVFAHRGFALRNPENTLAAFQAAIDIGCHGIETDVRCSADGEAIIIHDRLTPDGRPVAQQSRAEVEKALGHAIPTLTDVLAMDCNIVWNIEIKTPAAWAVAQPILAEALGQRRMLISSFHHQIAIEAARTLGVAAALLTAEHPVAVNTLLYPTLNMPSLRHVVWDFEIMDRDHLRQCNALGFRNFVYGAHTADEMRLCHEYGAHAIIVDRPDWGLAL